MIEYLPRKDIEELLLKENQSKIPEYDSQSQTFTRKPVPWSLTPDLLSEMSQTPLCGFSNF